MGDGGSIVEFFYNIIPGSFFLFLLEHDKYQLIESFVPESNQALSAFAFIIFALLLGFVFQGMTKFTRGYLGWNKRIFNKVINKNLIEFKIVKNIFSKEIEHNDSQDKTHVKIFYFMDNYVRGNSPAFMPTHFSSRFALWSNILFALLTMIVIKLINCSWIDTEILILIIFSIISLWLADEHFTGFYDSVLKVFYVNNKFKKKI